MRSPLTPKDKAEANKIYRAMKRKIKKDEKDIKKK